MILKTTEQIFNNKRVDNDEDSNEFDRRSYSNLLLYVKTRVALGTTPVMTVTVQTSPDKINWYNLEQIVVTAVGSETKRVTNFGNYVKINFALSGTTPVFDGVDAWLVSESD